MKTSSYCQIGIWKKNIWLFLTKHSNEETKNCRSKKRVPQEIVLSPLLFVIFIKKLLMQVSTWNFFAYADYFKIVALKKENTNRIESLGSNNVFYYQSKGTNIIFKKEDSVH